MHRTMHRNRKSEQDTLRKDDKHNVNKPVPKASQAVKTAQIARNPNFER